MKKTLSVFLSLIMIVSVISAIGLSASAASTKTVSGKFNYSYAAQVLDLVNKERSAYGLKPVTMTEALTDGAMIRATETTVSFSHTRPNGENCFTAFNWTSAAGENIAYGQRTPEQVMNGWMNSSGHRANILSSKFTTIGIGCFEYNGTYYWSQAFSGGTGSSYSPSGSKSATVEVSLTSGVQSRVVSLGSDSTTATTTTKPATTKPTTTQKQTTTNRQTTTATTTAKQTTTRNQSTTAATTTERQTTTRKQTTTAATTARQTTTKKQTTTAKATTQKQTTTKKTASTTTTKCTNNKANDIASIIAALTKAPCIKQICAVDNGFTVCWNELSCATQYQIRYCTNSDMKNCKTVTVKDCSSLKKTICDLQNNENYYVQVRACNIIYGMNIYSPWSAVKCVKTK
ncbi:MAG: hypothetical protein J1E36_02895 [Eubacterium sp.]|nr:hypothetical protein [Eubacterium sp.]